MNIASWFRRLSTIALSILFSLTIFSAPANALVTENYKTLRETNACVSCDLSGEDLSGLDLYGAVLTGANLSQVR